MSEFDLLRAFDALPTLPAWLVAIRDARSVVVRASEHVGEGDFCVLNPNTPPFDVGPPMPLLVLCRSDDAETLREAVRDLRSPVMPTLGADR